MFKYLLVVSAAGGASAAISSLESMARSGSLRPAHMTHTSADPGPNVNAGVYLDNLRCGLHPNVNLTSVEGYHGEIQGLWQPYCATNRGIFVLQPGNPGWENQTYSCGRLPTDWAIGNDIGKLINYPAPVALHTSPTFVMSGLVAHRHRTPAGGMRLRQICLARRGVDNRIILCFRSGPGEILYFCMG